MNRWAIFSFLFLLATVNTPFRANAEGTFKDLVSGPEPIGTLSGPPSPGVTIVAPNYNGVLFVSTTAQEALDGNWGPYYTRAAMVCRKYGYTNYVAGTPVNAWCNPICTFTEIDSGGTPRTHKYRAKGAYFPAYFQDLTCN